LLLGAKMCASDIEKFKRYEKVKYMLQALPHPELIRSLREADDLARVSFNGALERYIQGSSDCVFHAAFSVEMALILRLDKSLTEDEKERVKEKNGLMLSGSIDLASKKGILKKKDIEKAWKLNHLRNISAHPANAVAFIKQQYRAVFNMEKEMPDVYSLMEEMRKTIILPKNKEAVQEDFSTILKSASEYVKQRIEKLPDLDWCASQDTLQFQKKRATDYYKDVSKRILTTEGIQELLENVANNVVYMQTTYAYAGRDEYEALNCAYDILKSLGII
jgi:hypothetical protein